MFPEVLSCQGPAFAAPASLGTTTIKGVEVEDPISRCEYLR